MQTNEPRIVVLRPVYGQAWHSRDLERSTMGEYKLLDKNKDKIRFKNKFEYHVCRVLETPTDSSARRCVLTCCVAATPTKQTGNVRPLPPLSELVVRLLDPIYHLWTLVSNASHQFL